MKKENIAALCLALAFSSCTKYFDKDFWQDKAEKHLEDASSFEEIGSIDVGDVGAAEISAFDPKTNRLFIVNNSGTNRIDVVDLSNPVTPSLLGSIALEKYSGAVNSVSVHDGMLAAAIEAANKQADGKIVLFDTRTYAELEVISSGALPDMITFSPDGKYILTANEGEPSADYTSDPIGSVTIVATNDFTSRTIDFSAFASQQNELQKQGLRIFGPNASFAQDLEPEYITVSKDSKTAWVTLQENNAIAKIDLQSGSVTNIFPLGFKAYSTFANSIDPSDRDENIFFRSVPVFGIYMPDAIAVIEKRGTPYLITANEGDAREYDAFEEMSRLEDLELDENAFPDGSTMKQENQLGRLNVTKTLGDANGDGKYEALYSLGARSFSVWNGNDGKLMFDSKNNLEEEVVEAGLYDDGRSDDKGAEPEGIAIGQVGLKDIAFIGMERADAVALYDISEPANPIFLKMLQTGDAPEGVLFIHRNDSPIKKSLLIISSENDGVVKIYAPKN